MEEENHINITGITFFRKIGNHTIVIICYTCVMQAILSIELISK